MMRRNGLSMILLALALLALSAILFMANSRERARQRHAREHERDRLICETNVRLIGQSMKEFADAHEGRLPESFEELFAWDVLLPPRAFLCPRDARAALSDSPERAFPRNISYVYLVNGLNASAEHPRVIALEERQYHEDGVNAIYSDGRTEYLDLESAMKIHVPPRYPLPATATVETTQPSTLPSPAGAGSAGTSR